MATTLEKKLHVAGEPKVMELVSATAVLINDKYVGCYYNVDGGYIRVFNRAGETDLVYSLGGVYEWLGYLESYKP